MLVAYEQKGKGVDGLVEVACSDDALPNNLSEITFVAEADTTYYLMVGTCCGATAVPGGDLKLNVEKLKS